MKRFSLQLQKGFTLVELIVVVAIIGLLASILMAGLDEAREKGRDARRLADMEQIQIVLELYRDSFGDYPGTTNSYGENDCSWDSSGGDGDGDGHFFIDPLSETGMIAKVPVDPINSGSCDNNFEYRYYRYSAGSAVTNYGCQENRGNVWVLGVKNIESFDSSNRPNPNSPGFACTSRDWGDEFDWVVGGYQY